MCENYDGLDPSSHHIVIVGDNESELLSLVRLLIGAGYRPSCVPSTEAVNTIQEQCPPFVLLSPSLPDGIVVGLCSTLAVASEYEDVTCLLVVSCDELSNSRRDLLGQGVVAGALVWPSDESLVLSWLRMYALQASARRPARESCHNYLEVYDKMPVVMLFFDPENGRIVDANFAAERFYGWSKSELRKKRVWEINTASREEIASAMRQAQDASRNNFQFRHRLCDGSVRDVSVYSAPVQIHGRYLLYSIVFDITLRKEAEAALVQARNDWENIFQAIGQPAVVLGCDFEILAANRAVLDLTGLDMQSISGRKCFEVFHKGEEPHFNCPVVKMKHTGVTEQAELEMNLFCKTYMVSCTPVFDSQGTLAKIIHVAIDVSDRKNFEKELEVTNRNLKDALRKAQELGAQSEMVSQAKSEFLANMSHEIRTPLNGASGMIEVLQQTELDPEQRDFARKAQNCLSRLNRLLADILDLSKIEAGKLGLHEDVFDLTSMRQQLSEVFLFSASAKKLRLEFVFDSNLPVQVRGDEARLRQILFNLVGNAVKFTEQGFVRVEVKPLSWGVDGRMTVLFTIRDSGPGIAEDILNTIFEPFIQGEQSYVREHQGAGLGLAIVRRLVDLMGGDISLQSEMGQGTVVTFFLPFELNAVKESSEQVSVNIVKPPVRRILLAEDDLVNAMFVETMLARIGCQVVVARDGKEALRKLREEFFDVVLMDVQMPIMDGVEATRIVRSWEGGVASIPIIALTAYAMCGDSEKFLAAGMNAYLTKPVSMQEIIRTIDQVMTENKSAQVEEIQCFSHQAGVLS